MEGVEALMNQVYVFPLVGLVLGSIIGIIAKITSLILPSNLVAIIVLITIYRLCGINHIDGLADFGDGVVAHGTIEKKVQAMKDVSLGTGGAVFISILLIAAFSVLSSFTTALLLPGLIVGEVAAKQGMIAFAAFSSSLQKGFGQIMIERTTYKEFAIGLIISSILSALVLGVLGLASLILSQLAALIMVLVAKRNFRGATGDGIGATNEIARVIALAGSLVLGGLLSWTLL